MNIHTNESEILPFPNKDIEFRLPDPDYRELMDREYPRAPRPSQRHQEDRPPPLEEHHHSAPAQSSHHHVHGKGKGREKEHKHEHKEKEHKEHHHKEKESSGTPAHLSRSHDAEDSPKREARKRTRQSLADSPATRERDTPSAKRARRTQ